MGRKKLNEGDKKTRFSITMNKGLAEIIKDEFTNISLYLEYLVKEDLIKNGKIDGSKFL